MGASSYIVSGLGNPASYNSCSHGAGRAMSRTKAKQELSEGSLRALMEGIEWDSRHASKLVDEHPLAYKNIDEVMAAQADLVRIEHTLHQILNLKGT
jgi:tRNA-splicing ligase RtcB